MASAPASVMTIAMTTARRGRSMKTDENILLGRPIVGGGGRRGGDLDAGTDLLDAVHDHLLALVEAGRDHGGCRRCLAELNAPLLDGVVGTDDIDIAALLVGQYGTARDAENLDRL